MQIGHMIHYFVLQNVDNTLKDFHYFGPTSQQQPVESAQFREAEGLRGN